MKKQEVLEQSIALITGHREDDYGDARTNFRTIAALWSVVLGTQIEPWQVALCMDQVKTARIVKTPTHVDSWADKGGYVGLGCELATESTMEVSPLTKETP